MSLLRMPKNVESPLWLILRMPKNQDDLFENALESPRALISLRMSNNLGGPFWIFLEGLRIIEDPSVLFENVQESRKS